jgi:competence ComEA-like helix-hairpin-helix protein
MATVRRLTAILAADVAGYSRLMGVDEEGTHERLKAHLAQLVYPKIAEHRGRIVKNTGDGFLAEFASVVDAVRCAVEVQRRMAERNAGIPASERIEFRIGINLGDVIVEEHDIFGDGVNVAARLEGLAEPGGICLSGVVRDQVGDRFALVFQDMGEQQVKNIARPIRVYRGCDVGAAAPNPSARSSCVPDKVSIAVLPFVNLSGDPEEEYFADGMVEEIITALSRIRWLFVIARNSSFTYKGRTIDVKQVGRELGVCYVLEGSVRKAGSRVRIAAQLIDAATGAHLWADRFDGSLEDVFDLQDRVASTVAGTIEPALQAAEAVCSARRPTRDLTAYDLYLRASGMAADSKARLEDLYLPYRPKRRTKAQIAREAGLEPLAEALLARPDQSPEQVARRYIEASKGVSDSTAALEGARAILVERFTEDATLIGTLREEVWSRGRLCSRVRAGKAETGAKFADYFEFSEPLAKLPSHRILALLRGEKEDVLTLELVPDPTAPDRGEPGGFERLIANRFKIADQGRPGDGWLIDTVRSAWRTRILAHIESDLRLRLWQAAEDTAVQVFAGNLRDLLLAAPAGARPTMGLDPGYRTGVKVAVVTGTGQVAATTTIYPHEPQRRWDESIAQLARLAGEHRVELIAIGNGTASRETDRLGAELIRLHPELELTKVVVSEAGASVYSASAFTSQELPGLDVSLRGAVSIARRLQDPLAELVKIVPQSIGVGQYQHDLSQQKLSRSLDAVVEDCVNAVGVDVNTASTPLLSRVSGIGEGLARSIVDYREAHGPFRTRAVLKKVPRLGPKAFALQGRFRGVRPTHRADRRRCGCAEILPKAQQMTTMGQR